MRYNTLILVKEECLQWLSECRLGTVGVSELVWKQVPDSGFGDWECPTAECVPWFYVWCRLQKTVHVYIINRINCSTCLHK